MLGSTQSMVVALVQKIHVPMFVSIVCCKSPGEKQ